MKIKYEFVNGESREIEVADELGAMLLDFDHKENNTNRKETRRHSSLDGMDYEGVAFDSHEDIAGMVERDMDIAALRRAMETLSPSQLELVQAVFFEKRSVASVARDEYVDESSIRERLRRIYKKIKNVF